MKKRNILVSLLVFLLIVVTVLITDNYRPFLFSGNQAVPISDTTRVKEINIIGDDSLTLSKQENGRWLVNGSFPADPLAVSNLLYALSNIEVNGKTRMDTSGVKMRQIIINNGQRRVWYLLPREKLPVLFRKGSRSFNIVRVKAAPAADLAELTTPDAGYWRNRQLISLIPDEIAKVEVHVPESRGHGFIMKQSGDGFHIESLEGINLPDSLADHEKMLMYSSYFHDIFYESSLKDEDKTSALLASEPEYTIMVTDTEGKEYRLDIYPKRNENGERDIFRAWVRYNNSDEILVVPYIALDLLMQNFEHFTTPQ